jgi:predicted ATPase
MVQPLRVPDWTTPAEPKALEDVPAVELFMERARAADPEFALTGMNASIVAELCARLDGLPLGLELAAARARSLPTETMLARLRGGVEQSGPRDAPARQQSLHATVGWSHDLLGHEEQALFWQLGFFEGGWTVQAAEAVCDGGSSDVLDCLASLLDKSLILREVDSTGGPRFRMLETIWGYARERLAESGEKNVCRGAMRCSS